MKFPYLTNISSSTNTIDVFGGYNHNHRISENEFFDTENMTSDHYPLLAPRGTRGKKELGMFEGTIAAATELNGKWYVLTVPTVSEGPAGVLRLYEDGKEVFSIDNDIFPGIKRQLVRIGSKLVVFPEKFYYDTIATKKESEPGATSKSGTLYAETKTILGTDDNYAIFSLCKSDGTGIEDYTTVKPDNAEEGQYWLDSTADVKVLKQWSNGYWTTVPSTYTRIKLPVISGDFKAGDGVNIKYYPNSVSGYLNEKTTSVILETVYDDKEGYGDYFVVRGLLDAEYESPYYVKIERRVPEMDFVIESGNRLWGCKFGKPDVASSPVNEIYASALGDPTNWNVFEGTSMDSYVASVGSEGEFTGAVSFRGYPIFFKEKCIHKIYGSYPENYQIQTLEVRGVQKGSHDSLAVVNEVLYYKANDTVCAYESSIPIDVGSVFGGVGYNNAVGGGFRDKYYISMSDEAGGKHLFVYDTQKGIWHRENGSEVKEIVSTPQELYLRNGNVLNTVGGSGDEKIESKVRWYAETGNIGLNVTNKKKLKNVKVRMSVPVGAKVRISVEYDSSGQWEQVYMKSGTKLDAFSVPIRPRKCDHFRLKFEGEGDVKIYALEKTIEYTGGVK